MLKLSFYTSLALLGFAGNSVLCRLALGDQLIDPSSFTSIRLVSGIVMLLLIFSLRAQGVAKLRDAGGSWLSAVLLFVYALSFSYAYVSLDTGTGALVLFGSVQITMILVSYFTGHKLLGVEWAGLFLAFSGFVYLLLPTLSTPSFMGFILMSLSGVAWGFYTLRGRASVNPLNDTAFNFLRTLPLVVLLFFITVSQAEISLRGVFFAIFSGAIASGVAYTIWYKVLADLSAVQAAVLQLLVPVIAAVGGIIFAAEIPGFRLIIATVLVLGGVLLVVLGRPRYQA